MPKAVTDAAKSEGTPLSSPQKAHGSASEDDGTQEETKEAIGLEIRGNDRGADNGNVTTRPPQAWTGDSVC